VGCGLGHRRCLKSLWHHRTSLPLLCGAVGAGGSWVCSSSISCRQHLQLEGSCFGLQQENAASLPSAGRGEAKPGDRLLRRHHLRCFLIPCPGASSSRTCLSPGAGRGRDGRSAGEQPVLSGVEEAHGQAARAVGTLTCCCYHSPCDRLRNSKYFLSDKGDWGRPEISGRVWASLRSQTPGRRGQSRYWECWASGAERPRRGAVWEPSKLPFPNLQPVPSMAREDAPACFPTPPGPGSPFPRDAIWARSCAGAEPSRLLGTAAPRKAQAAAAPSRGRRGARVPSPPARGSGRAVPRL